LGTGPDGASRAGGSSVSGSIPGEELEDRPDPPVRDFSGEAVLTLLLYGLGYFPGLIMNLVFLHATRSYRDRTGHSPERAGCLVALLRTFVFLPLFLLLGALLLGLLVLGPLQWLRT
jgi:hypothetical protein